MTPEGLAALHAQVFRTPRPWTAAEFASLLGSPHCFLCQQPGGFVLGRAVADEAELLSMAVARARQRQGIGARLMAGFLAEALARGARTAFLEVAENNVAALALYRRAGFGEVGRRPGYYAEPDGRKTDALVLLRPLGVT